MVSEGDRATPKPMHPLNAATLACCVPLYVGGFLSDVAYAKSYEIQWSNFAAWLIAGGMVFTGIALTWALADLIRAPRRRGTDSIAFLLLLSLFIVGLIGSFVHAKDAWAIMPEALVLSGVTSVLAIAATLLGFFTLSSTGEK